MAAWEDCRAWLSDRRANLYLRKTWTSQISLECGSGFVFYRECAVTLRPFPPLQRLTASTFAVSHCPLFLGYVGRYWFRKPELFSESEVRDLKV